MNLAFRKSLPRASEPVAPGELLLRPRDPAQQECRAMAHLVLDQGWKELLHGAEPIEQIVVREDPTLDDMLAAMFAQRLIAGQPLPPAAKAWATYTDLARHGLNRLGDVPADRSLVGIYLAVLDQANDNWSDPDNRKIFLDGWSRIVERLLAATVAKSDPYTTLVFDGPEFGPEHTILRDDPDVFRQDVARGERWWISMPGGPKKALALLLRSPTSILFKQWTWKGADKALAEPPLLLIVAGGRYRWTICTNPIQHLSLKSLADALQAAELAHNPKRAAEYPWFDGQPFKHTLVAGPHDGGSLSDKQVLGVIKHWAKARPIERRPNRRDLLVAGGAAAALAGIGFLTWPFPHVESSHTRGGAPAIPPAEPVDDPQGWQFDLELDGSKHAIGPIPFKDHALLIATNEYDNWQKLYNPIADATALQQVLAQKYGFDVELVTGPTMDDIINALERQETLPPSDQLLIYIAGHGAYRPGTKEGFVVARDSEKEGPKMAHYIPDSRLRSIIEGMPCNHLLVILDVCFGGLFDPHFNFKLGEQLGPNRGSAPRDKSVPNPEFIYLGTKHPCRRYLTSCGNTPTNDGAPGTHSPFAKELLESLHGDGDGIVTLAEIETAMYKAGLEPSRGAIDRHDEGDFLFIRKEVRTAVAAGH